MNSTPAAPRGKIGGNASLAPVHLAGGLKPGNITAAVAGVGQFMGA
ncbi:MAG: hypothetical protein Tsb002_27760 [Wenzhouxiangellaceae bacterium]